MSLPLTTDQQGFIDAMDLTYHNFKTALVQAIKTDNDRSSTLAEAFPKLQALLDSLGPVRQAVGSLRVGDNILRRGDGENASDNLPAIEFLV